MKTIYDLSSLEWKLTGWLPYLWRLGQPVEVSTSQSAEISSIKANVPGSVQYSLLQAGLIPDWNKGLNYRECQWVENFHWIYEAILPANWISKDVSFRLACQGLDGSGWIRLNGKDVAQFNGSHIPHEFDLTSHLTAEKNILQIIFDCPPRWLGQFGYTSNMTEWKVRFNYTWDWTARIVQIGIWDALHLVASDGREIRQIRAVTEIEEEAGTGNLRAWGKVLGKEGDTIRVILEKDGRVIGQTNLPAAEFNAGGAVLSDLAVDRWWPNLHGKQPLYTLRVILQDHTGRMIDENIRRVGFRHVAWRPCEGAPANADPWICAVNGKSIFLQGANWVPVVSNFAEVTEEQYRQRLTLYRDLGFNILRVWGGSVLERELFYNLCDELGLLVWQEFPLSSSGCDDYPPEDEKFIDQMEEVAASYIERRQHHPCLIIWCGGNELITRDGSYVPVDTWHPMIKRLETVAKREDPSRRFLVTSPSGPKVHGVVSEFGKGVHWDVHGPWQTNGFGMKDSTLESWESYWKQDDALFRSEIGNAGASPVDILKKYLGNCSLTPMTAENPYFRRPISWWVDYHLVTADHGREPADLEEYVTWSQERQAKALSFAVKTCKDRFPRCGGVILWMGHDCYPCAVNTAVIDFEGRPKPAGLAVGEIFRGK
jgi:beta-mannosidase